MKKILSLALALLMFASLALSASASTVLDVGGTKYITDVYGDRDAAVLKNVTSVISKGSLGRYEIYDELYTNWYDVCPKCGGVALYYVKSGKICWQCLESDCDASGILDTPAVDKDSRLIYDERCPECGSDYFTTYLDTVIKDGKLVDQYFCGRCCIVFYENARDIAPVKSVKCPAVNCGRNAEFLYYSVEKGVLYANYRCAAGHDFRKVVDDKYEEDDDELYRVKVICTYGGDYAIAGGSYAEYGDEKTITFEADRGYVLTDVSVNGYAVPVKNDKITITVKSNTTVRATFAEQKSMKNYTITSSINGKGKISVMKNDVKTDAAKVTASYADTVSYRFTPASKNYAVSDVKIDGKSVGKVTSYTFNKIKGSHTVEVTFKWNNPFCDVKDAYLNAVEYVTESGIMSAYKVTQNGVKNNCYFSGATKITVKTFAAALAEMADVNDKLSTDDKRIEWAQKNGVVGKKWDLSETCDVQTACDMVKSYLEAIEDINDISFKNVKAADTAEETAIKIGLATAKGYKGNRDLNRYDLAAICRLISTLPYTD